MNFLNFLPACDCFYHRKIPVLESHFNSNCCPLVKTFYTQNRIFTNLKCFYILFFTKIVKPLLFSLPLCRMFSMDYREKTFTHSRSYYCVCALISLICRTKIELLYKTYKINNLLCKQSKQKIAMQIFLKLNTFEYRIIVFPPPGY